MKAIEQYLDVKALVQQRAQIRGIYPQAPVAKILGKIEPGQEQIELDLKLYKAHFGLDILEIEWQTTVTCTCERCLKPMTLELGAHTKLAMCQSAKQLDTIELPDEYEPFLFDNDDLLSIEEVLAQEILLLLPLVPRHDKDSCETNVGVYQETSQEKETYKPFANLDSMT